MNDWNEKFQYSLGQQQEFDCEILKDHIPDSVKVSKTNIDLDKLGVDYIVTLKGGAEIYVDAKTRTPGCSKYWKNGQPELALEMWSVKEKRKIGWTLSEKTQVDYILYTFPKKDSDKYYFIPYQLLREAFKANGRSWYEKYGSKLQINLSYHSEAIFVPANIVLQAVCESMEGVRNR